MTDIKTPFFTSDFPPPSFPYATASRTIATHTSATPAASIGTFHSGVAKYVVTTPKTSASPIPTGNATASPAISIAATSKMFAILNTAPPMNADSHCHCACEISAKKALPAEPNEPAVKANASENSSTPIE